MDYDWPVRWGRLWRRPGSDARPVPLAARYGVDEMAALEVTRLLQNPLGHVAPPGQRGDIVRVSDGAATIYLDPVEYDAESEESLRAMLALAEPRGGCPSEDAGGSGRVQEPAAEARPRARRRRKPPEPVTQSDAAGSLTDPRRAGRRAQSLW
jgi:hypothetical protein